MKTISFDGKILILGCGGVSQCTIPLLLAHLKMPAERITVVDMLDNRASIDEALAKGVNYVQEEITRADFPQQFARYVGRGDMIVDLSWNLHSASVTSILPSKSGIPTRILKRSRRPSGRSTIAKWNCGE